MTPNRSVVALVAGMLCVGAVLAAQSADTFTARLIWVPISGANRADVTGKGSATATLSGTRLTVAGSFEGLAAPATLARLHAGVAKAARGEAIGDLEITKATSGTISGSVELTAEQLEGLKQGRIYMQVHSEKGVAPDGSNLWGWFLP